MKSFSHALWTKCIYKSSGSLSAAWIFRYGKTHCIHKQEKRLTINFSKQPSPLSAHVSWGFGFDLACKASQNSAQVALCVRMRVRARVPACSRLTLMGLNIQTDICCGSRLCLAVSHDISVLNETRDRKQSFCCVPNFFT